MQGLGSTYLTMQTIGGTVLGGLMVLIGGLGAIMAKTPKGKIIWFGVTLGGALVLWGSSKAREHISNNQTSADNYGLYLLAIGAIGAFATKVKGE